MKLAVILLIPMLGSCQAYEDYNLRGEAQRAIAAELNDPSSAQFRNVRVSEQYRSLGAVCGEVNGKNSFGAYAGYRQFMYSRKSGLKAVELGDTAPDTPDARENVALFDYNWRTTCDGEPLDAAKFREAINAGAK